MSKQEIQGILIGLLILVCFIVIIVGMAYIFGYIPGLSVAP